MSMSKQITATSSEQVGYGFAYVLNEYKKDYITGRLLTLVESLGLRDTQEKAFKDIIRDEINNWFSGEAIFISGEINTALQNLVARIENAHEHRVNVPRGVYGKYLIEMNATKIEDSI